MNVLRFLQTVDRRLLYALLFLTVAIPLLHPIVVPTVVLGRGPLGWLHPTFALRPFVLPVTVSPSTLMVYDEIQSLPPNSFVLLAPDWAAGSRGENGPQTEALMRHLMKRHIRFAMVSFDPQGPIISEAMAKRLQDQYGYVEGVNWTNLGFKVDQQDFLKAFVLDVRGAAPQDYNGKPVASEPVMAGIRSAHDIRLVIDISASDSYTYFIKFMQGPYKENLKMAAALTSVMAPEAENFVSSRQLIGCLVGLKGAIEYEHLLGVSGTATAANASLSAAHVLIIFFIVLGNVAMLLERAARRREDQE